MRARRIIALLMVFIFAAGATIGCSKLRSGSANAAEGAKVTINLGSEPPQMSTILTTDVVSHNVQSHVFEGLTRLGKDGKPIPGIAKDWKQSSDGLEWTFNLRDSKWSDGSPVTAKDFEFAWLESLNPDNAAEYAYLFYMFKNGEKYNKKEAKREDVGIKAKDDKTLVVTLERPSPFILDLCAFGNFMPVRQDFYAKQDNGKKYGTDADKMLYNGPWTIKTWEHENKLVLVKNPNYWDEKDIKLDQITMLMIKDSNTAYNSYVANEVDMIGLSGDQVPQAKNAGYTVNSYPDGATFYAEFNLTRKVLSNNNIRKALTYAIDRVSFCKNVLKNSSQAAVSFTNPVIFGAKQAFSKEIGPQIKDNNSAEAKELWKKGLDELGLKENPKLEFITDDTTIAMQNAQAIQEFWRKNLGFDVTITSLPFKARLERMTKKDFDIVLAGWSADYNDPISFLDMFETGNGNNHTSYSDKDYDALLKKAQNEKNANTRMDFLKQMEKKLMSDLPIAPVYWRYRDYTAKDYFKGIVRQWGQDIDLHWAYVDKNAKK